MTEQQVTQPLAQVAQQQMQQAPQPPMQQQQAPQPPMQQQQAPQPPMQQQQAPQPPMQQQEQQAQQARQQIVEAMRNPSVFVAPIPQTSIVDDSGNVVDNPYQSIIDQQQAQIAALMAQNDALNQQVTRMVQGGAQFSQQPQQVGQNWAYQPQQPNTAQQFAQGSLSDNQDWSLEALGKEIGKPRKEV